jgi:hypothetical protein
MKLMASEKKKLRVTSFPIFVFSIGWWFCEH